MINTLPASIMAAPRVRIEKLRATGVHCFVRLLSVHSPIEDIYIKDIEGTTRHTVINCDGCRGCRVQLFDPDAPPFPDGIGTLRNITIRSLRVNAALETIPGQAPTHDPVPLLRLETRCANVVIEDVTRVETAEDTSAIPSFVVDHLPGTIVHVDGTDTTVSAGEAKRSWAPRIGRMTIATPGL